MVDCNPMEVLFERRCAKFIYIAPEGLGELMSDISREVMRCHPKELCCFIADYLDALFISRENAKVAALLVEDVTEAGSTLQEILTKTNITYKQAVRAVKIIQRAFRRHIEEKKRLSDEIGPIDPHLIICKMMLRLNITLDTASVAARIIQQTWRCYKLRMDLWRAKYQRAVDWRAAARYTLRLYKNYAASSEYKRAVTLIQAAYRGYYTRKLLKHLVKRKKCPIEEVIAYLIAQYRSIEDEDAEHMECLPSQYTGTNVDVPNMVPENPKTSVRVSEKTMQRDFRKYVDIMGQDDGSDDAASAINEEHHHCLRKSVKPIQVIDDDDEN